MTKVRALCALLLLLFCCAHARDIEEEERERAYWQKQRSANVNNPSFSGHYDTIVTFSDFRSGSTLFVDKLNGCTGDMVLELWGDVPLPTYQDFLDRIAGVEPAAPKPLPPPARQQDGRLQSIYRHLRYQSSSPTAPSSAPSSGKHDHKYFKIQRAEFYRHYPYISYYLKHHRRDGRILVVVLERAVTLEQFHSWRNLQRARELNIGQRTHHMSAEAKRDLNVAVDPQAYAQYREAARIYFEDLKALCYYNQLNCVHLRYEELDRVERLADRPMTCQSSVNG